MPIVLAVALAAALVALVPLATNGQGTATPEAASGIPPVVWELRAIATAGGAVEPADPAAYTVQFLADGELRVRADCNRGRGSYELDGQRVAIGPIGLSRKGCAAGSLDARFVETLSRATDWSFRDDRFLLDLPGEPGALTFAPALEGVVWQWRGFAGGNDEIVAPADPTAYAIEFLPDATLALRTDCSSGTGGWSADPPAIDLRPDAIASTGCAPNPGGDRFIADLNQVSSFVFRRGVLYLALPADAGTHAFAATPRPGTGTPTAGA